MSNRGYANTDMIKNATAFQAALAGIGQAPPNMTARCFSIKMFSALTSVTNAMTASVAKTRRRWLVLLRWRAGSL